MEYNDTTNVIKQTNNYLKWDNCNMQVHFVINKQINTK